MEKKEREQKKKEILTLLEKQMGNITVSCKRVGIDRTTFYDWKEKYPEWREKAEKILEEKKEEMDDYAENKLFNHIRDDNIATLIFYLKTRHPKYNKKIIKAEIEGKLTNELELSDEDKNLLNKAIDKAYPKEED